MEEKLISSEVRDQMLRTLDKFKAVVLKFPEKEWRKGETPYQRPAGLAAHLLSTIDFYTSGLTADQFPWGKRLGCDWEDPRDDVLPSQELVLTYLQEMEGRVRKWTERTELSAAEDLHPYTGKTVLARAVYLIRHTESHLGELNLELRRRGFMGPEWK